MKKFFEEFKAFAMRGNVIDMAVNKMHDKLSKPAEPEPEKAPEPTKEEVLLTEIRDLLKEQSK